MKMSIHRALAEIKMLDKRIERSINGTAFVGSKKKSSSQVNNSTMTKELFEAGAKADYQSVNDLINRRTLIKRLVVLSNATTDVVIGGVTYKVAEAIENKKIIQYKQTLLIQLSSQYNGHMANVNRNNERVESNLNDQISAMLGTDKQTKSADMEGFMNQYKAQNEWELVDGLGIEAEIQKLQKEIEDFENNVDFVLSESNAITFVEIED